MDRQEFLKLCGVGCLGMMGITSLLGGCAGTLVVNAVMSDVGLVVPLNAFDVSESSGVTYRRYIVAQNDRLQYPVCLFRFSATEYAALLMRCTHKGAELHVMGERLVCPTHGSEFTSIGTVQNGPADRNLRTFPVSISANTLTIHLT